MNAVWSSDSMKNEKRDTDHLSNELEAGGELHPEDVQLLLIDQPFLETWT